MDEVYIRLSESSDLHNLCTSMQLYMNSESWTGVHKSIRNLKHMSNLPDRNANTLICT